MAIKISGTDVIDNSRGLVNIASVDATTVSTLSAAGVGGPLINTPVILSPASGTTYAGNTLTGSNVAFSSSYAGSLDNVEYQASIFSNFSNTFFESFSTNTLTTVITPPPIGGLVFYVRLRYGSDNHRSNYSNTISYTNSNSFINQPTLTVTW